MNTIILIAGCKGKGKDTLVSNLAKKYEHEDMAVVPGDHPEDIFDFRMKYDGNPSVFTVLLARDDELAVWHEVNDTADLRCNTDEPLADVLSEIDDMLSKRRDEMNHWILTDSDCNQHMMICSRNKYVGLQIIQLPNAHFGIARMNIDLSDYSKEEVQSVFNFYDYTWEDLHHSMPDIDAMRIAAECIFEHEAMRNICNSFSSYEDAVAGLENIKKEEPATKNKAKSVLETQWTSYADEREFWIRPLEPICAASFEVARAAASTIHADEWAFTHRFIHLGDYRLNDDCDADILNRDGNMDEDTFEICNINSIMLDKDGKPDRINDPKYLLDYALLAAKIADTEDGAQYMREEQAMNLIDRIVGRDRWKF